MTTSSKRSHIKIECEEDQERYRHDVTPTKFSDFSLDVGDGSLLHAKKSIQFSSSENLTRENSSDSFIVREVEKRDLFFKINKVKFQGG